MCVRGEGVDLPVDLLIMSCDNWNLKLPFLATRCQYRGVHLPVDLLIWNLKLPFLATRCQYRGVDLPLDLLMWTLTSILHVKFDKYELSELKSFILIWGVSRGCYIWHASTMLTDCLLLKLFRNKENSHLFLKNPKWLPKASHNIYPIMDLWGVHLLADLG